MSDKNDQSDGAAEGVSPEPRRQVFRQYRRRSSAWRDDRLR